MLMETELLQASRAGDRSAFERIVEQYQAAVCAITFSGTGRIDVSEELAQETFVNAWQNLHQLRDLSGFRAWLYSIARHALHNYHRRRQPVSLDACPEEATTDDTHNPPEILMREEEHVLLEQAILRLPAQYREPLVMFHRQQQSIRESAEALGLSEATFRTRLHRARNLLREDLAQRIEQALGRTGPRKEFTKAVMVAIGGLPIALSATADAAASVSSAHVAVSGAISTVLSSLGAKIAVVTAVVAAGTLLYIHSNRSTSPTLGDTSSTPPRPSTVDTRQEPTNEGSLQQTVRQDIDRGGIVRDGRQFVRDATSGEEPASQPDFVVPETVVTGAVLDKNTLIPLPGARVGFNPGEMTATDADGRFRLSYTESRDEVFVYAMAPGYAIERIALRMNIGGHEEVPLKVEPGLTLAGVVVDPNQNPVPNARLCAIWDCFGYPEVTSDAQGQFKIAGLPPDVADLHLHVECTGYRGEAISIPLERARLGEDAFREIVLTPEPPRAVLLGRVTDAGAKPVAQAIVGCYGSLIKTQTDQEGRYALQDLKADSFLLYVSHSQYPLFVQDVTLPAEQDETTLDVQLANPCRLSGRVVDDQGQPVAEAVIGMDSYQGKNVWGLTEFSHLDAEGQFIIPNAPSMSEYRLLVLGDDILRATCTVDSDLEECLITASRSGRIYGRVVDAQSGSPISCFRVVMEHTSHIPATWVLEGYTFTSEKGHFDTGRLELAVGRQVPLTICAEGYDPLALDAVPVPPISQDPGRTVFRLQPNERRSTLYVGRVVSPEGQPVPGAEVGFRRQDLKNNQRGFSRVLTDVSGSYMISSVDPQEQVMFVRAHGYAPIHRRMSELLTQTSGTFADVVLDPPGTVHGCVWDKLGQPVIDARITSAPVVRSQEEVERIEWLRGALWPDTQTDENGHYRLADLPGGEMHIFVSLTDQRRIAPKIVTVHPGDALELDFGDQGGFVVAGVVTEGEDPLDSVEVELKATDGSQRSHAGRTDASGRFKFLHVPPGRYVFAALRPQDGAKEQIRDPNDLSHVLYEVMDVQSDLDLMVDYRTRSINR